MRIRKGSRRCLPPSPTNRSSLQVREEVPQHVGATDDAKDSVDQALQGVGATEKEMEAALALLSLAALGSSSSSDSALLPENFIGSPQQELGVKRKRGRGKFHNNRDSADFKCLCSFCTPGNPGAKWISSFHGEEFVSQPPSRVAAVVSESQSHENSCARASGSRKVQKIDSPQCMKNDGRLWRCSQPTQPGFALCKFHRDLLNKSAERRDLMQKSSKRRERAMSELAVPDPPFMYVANARVMPDCDVAGMVWSPFLDEELAHNEHRQFVKAKSIRSIMWNT